MKSQKAALGSNDKAIAAFRWVVFSASEAESMYERRKSQKAALGSNDKAIAAFRWVVFSASEDEPMHER